VEIVEEELRAKGSRIRVDDQSLAQMQTLADVVSALASAPASAKQRGATL
jgi:hypothetical protein